MDLKEFQSIGKEAIEEMKSVIKPDPTGNGSSVLDISDVLKTTREELKQFRRSNVPIMKKARSIGIPRLRTNRRARTLVERAQAKKIPRLSPKPEKVQTVPLPAELQVLPQVTFASLERDRQRFLKLKKKRTDARNILERESDNGEGLSINERRAFLQQQKKENALQKEFEQTEFYLNQDEISKGPLKAHQDKLQAFSDSVKSLRNKMKTGHINTRAALLELAQVYLESQRYLDALDPRDSLKLARHAELTKTVIGSYEMAVWAYKQALRFQPNDGKTHLALSALFDEMGDGGNSVRHARRARFLFAQGKQKGEIAELENKIASLEKKYASTILE